MGGSWGCRWEGLGTVGGLWVRGQGGEGGRGEKMGWSEGKRTEKMEEGGGEVGRGGRKEEEER